MVTSQAHDAAPRWVSEGAPCLHSRAPLGQELHKAMRPRVLPGLRPAESPGEVVEGWSQVVSH